MRQTIECFLLQSTTFTESFVSDFEILLIVKHSESDNPPAEMSKFSMRFFSFEDLFNLLYHMPSVLCRLSSQVLDKTLDSSSTNSLCDMISLPKN